MQCLKGQDGLEVYRHLHHSLLRNLDSILMEFCLSSGVFNFLLKNSFYSAVEDESGMYKTGVPRGNESWGQALKASGAGGQEAAPPFTGSPEPRGSAVTDAAGTSPFRRGTKHGIIKHSCVLDSQCLSRT